MVGINALLVTVGRLLGILNMQFLHAVAITVII